MSEREALAIPAFDDDLDDFAPRAGATVGQGALAPKHAPRAADTRKAVDAVSRFPSREASSDGQLNLKGPQHVLDRFKTMCKADRRAYYDMLEILMDRYEGAS
ncbi:hypothetical protein [uncultured Pelagimonas sp.]|uniref:hypothetical protein n=1 Tax=uncultured Pelagimonas sp. TaxID=1618102 RepID=UPI00261A2BAC|nr:hypothetical protein [uncultured Pelagimonas sp.]